MSEKPDTNTLDEFCDAFGRLMAEGFQQMQPDALRVTEHLLASGKGKVEVTISVGPFTLIAHMRQGEQREELFRLTTDNPVRLN